MPRVPARFAALFAFAALPVFAADGNASDGHIKVYTCSGCHGIPGYKNAYPSYHVPRIYGQNQAYIAAALAEYRAGERSHPTMRAQGESMSDQDIADIAAYLSRAGEPPR